MALTVGTVSAEPGEKVSGTFGTIETRDGATIEHPVHVVNGEDDGPTLWIQACVHGNEYVGSVAVLDVWQAVDPADVAGAIVFVPALNVSAFRHGSRGSPHERFYLLDLNRVFPGDPDGTFTQQLAAEIFAVFADTADYLVDFHTGAHPDTRWALYTAIDGVEAEAARLGRALGFPFLLATEPEGEALPLEGAMFVQGALEGIPAVIVESGMFGRVDEPARADAVQGIHNVAGELGVLDVEPSPVADEVVEVSEWTVPHASRGGRLFCDVDSGDEFAAGDVLGRVEDFDGETVETFEAPFDGHVLMSSAVPFVGAGDGIFQLAEK